MRVIQSTFAGCRLLSYYQRLRNIYAEANMESATVGTHLICKLIASLPSEGNKGRIKEQLLKLFSKLPNRTETTKFITSIKENEAIVTAKDFKVQTGRGVARVQEEQQTGCRPHHLCGLIHKRGNCSKKCSECGKYGSHKESECWERYPHKKPKDFETPKRNKKRDKRRDRNRSKSKETES